MSPSPRRRQTGGERVAMADRSELVESAAGDTGSNNRGVVTIAEIAGNGYQIQLPGCRAAGFHEADRAPVVSRQSILVIHDWTNGRLVDDRATIRHSQGSNGQILRARPL